MPLEIVRNDITKMKVDAIVNAANESLLGGGGVDGAIHRAAGSGLLAECRTLGGCKTGKAKITGGYNLPAKYVIHTVGPIYDDGKHGEKALLESCYRESLALAKENNCETVAFPLISSGVYGYPKDQALKVAIDVISDFLLENEMTVYIVIFDKAAYKISEKLFSDIAEYIDDNYVDGHTDYSRERMRMNAPMASMAPRRRRKKSDDDFLEMCDCKDMLADDDLDAKLKQIDESFSQMLLRKIDEKGMTASCSPKSAATFIISRANQPRLHLRSPWSFHSQKPKICFARQDSRYPTVISSISSLNTLSARAITIFLKSTRLCLRSIRVC